MNLDLYIVVIMVDIVTGSMGLVDFLTSLVEHRRSLPVIYLGKRPDQESGFPVRGYGFPR